MAKKSVIRLERFLQRAYMDNPSVASPTMSCAIRDLLTDLLHVGDRYSVGLTAECHGSLFTRKERVKT